MPRAPSIKSREVVFVIGNGRSGSSALTRVLSLCGCGLPRSVFGADEGNPKGFWEPAEAAKINVEFLLKHCSVHGDEVFVCDDHAQTEFIEQIQAFLAECPHERPLVIKEPLINSVAQFWFGAAQREGLIVKTVIPIRHPGEFSASAAEYASMPTDTALLAWMRENLRAEKQTREFPRVFVDYGNLLNNWRLEVTRVSSGLGIELGFHEAETIDAFLSHDLHRHRSTGAVVESPGICSVARTYAILSAAAQDEPIDFVTLDAGRASYNARGCNNEERSHEEYRKGLSELRDFFNRRPVWTLGRDY